MNKFSLIISAEKGKKMETEEKKKSGEHETMYPEKYEKDKFLEELRKSDPEKMSWMMLNYLVQKMSDAVKSGDESEAYGARYSDSRYREHNTEDMKHDGHMRERYSGMKMRYSSEANEAKERIGEMIGHELDEGEIKCLIIKEASSLIKKLSESEDYGAVKEFNELCMVMKAYSNMLPEDVEERAKEEAISGYSRMFSERHSYRSRIESRSERMLPVVEVDEFGRRGRMRDSMGRYR